MEKQLKLYREKVKVKVEDAVEWFVDNNIKRELVIYG
jgi:hypothetical protein